MSTATTTTPPPSGDDQPSQNALREADYIRFKNYAAIGFVVASPVLIALPPRKLDNLTVLLTGAFLISANHLTREYTGRSIVERIDDRISRSKSPMAAITDPLPSERAHEIQAQLRAARDAQLKSNNLVSDEIERLKRQQQQEKGAVERIWMGDEKPGWKERRLEEERKALEEGKGYGDLIMEHIWDVWNWGKKSSDQDDSRSKEEKK